MSDTKVSFGTVVDFIDASIDTSQWAASLKEDASDVGFAALKLGNGEIYAIRKTDARFHDWSVFLRAWHKFRRPVYVEADDSRTVLVLLPFIPRRIEHVAAQPSDGLLAVNVFASPSVHYLNTAHPNFQEMRKLLEQAADTGQEVLVTTDPNKGEILHVSLPEEPLSGHGFMPNGIVTEAESKVLFRDLTERFANRSTLPEAEAEIQFNDLAGQKQIPFDFPFDCCTARAHEMCRILRERGIVARKIWNYGNGWTSKPKIATLRVDTPNGAVQWIYHVAPLLAVKRPSGAIFNMAFDPSIFDHPARTMEWRERQQDPFSFSGITNDDIFYKDYFDFNDEQVILDPDFSQTNYLLTAHLASRASRK